MQDAAVQRVQVHEAVELVVHRRGRLAAGAGPVGRKRYSTRQPSRVTCQGRPRAPIAAWTPAANRSASGIMRSKASAVRTCVEGRPHRPQRERVAGERAADAADVDLAGRKRGRDAVGDLRRHAVRGGRDAGAERLADRDEVGVELPRAGAAARAGAERVGLVDDEERPWRRAELAHGVVVALVGQDDADVGERGLEQAAGDVAVRRARARAVQVVDLDDPRRLGSASTGAPMLCGRATRCRRRGSRRSRRPCRGSTSCARAIFGRPVERAGEPDPKRLASVAVSANCQLGRPNRRSISSPTQIASSVGQHERGPAARLRGDRLGGRLGRVAGHRAGVAEAEVDVLVAVDVAEPRARTPRRRTPGRRPPSRSSSASGRRRRASGRARWKSSSERGCVCSKSRSSRAWRSARRARSTVETGIGGSGGRGGSVWIPCILPDRRRPRRPGSEEPPPVAKTGVRVLVTLACQDCKRRNYQTQKSKRNSPDRIEFSKYCRFCGRHTAHKETR